MAEKTKKSEVTRVRLSAVERAELLAISVERGLSMSELLRRGARLAAGLGPSFEGDFRGEIVGLVRQVRGVAVNINQMTRAMNSGRVPPNRQLSEGFGQLTSLLADCQDAYLSLCARAQAAVLKSQVEGGDGQP